MVNREALLQGALEAAANGWLVAPIAVNAKAPIRGRHWNQEATSDPNRIRELWADTPYNVAGVTGRYLVVDVDVDGGKPGAASLERIAEEYGYLDTRVHRSPSGGFHYVYECPPDWEIGPANPINRDYPGIDLRVGDRESYVVLPPSEIDGRKYWVEVDIAPMPAPEWIRELRGGVVKRGESIIGRIRLDELPPGTVGSRDTTLIRLAGKLRREGNNATHIAAVLHQVNQTWANPLPLNAILRIAQSAERWRPDILGGMPAGRSDVENAKAVLLVSDNNLLYRHEDSRWTVWDGRKWGSDAHRHGYVTETIATIEDLSLACAEAEKYGPAQVTQKKADKMKSAAAQKALWYVMPGQPGVVKSNKAFDADPYLLNTPSGVVDLRTGDLGPHDKKLLLTHITNAPYDSAADMKEWEDFVLWCCSDDADQAHWLKVMLGQSLIGEQQEQVVLFMFGPGKNGKSQLTEAIRITLGDYGLESTADLLTAKGRDALHTELTAVLQGKRLVICPEPEKGSYWAAARVKSLTGAEAIPARHLYGQPFEFDPSHTLVVHGNYQPEVRDLSLGFRRRMRLIPFTNQVTDAQEVRNLGALLAGPAVLRWLIEGAIEYYRTGLPVCARIALATDEYLMEQDQFGRFFKDHCEQSASHWETIADLYAMYRWWADREGLRFIETKQELAQWLIKHKYNPVVRRKNGVSSRGYEGLKLIEMVADDLPA